MLLPDDLAEHILTQRQLDSRDRGGRGWQSKARKDQPFSWFDTVYQQVATQHGAIDSWWFNVNAPGEYTNWHTHDRWPRVAVLYVSDAVSAIEFREGEGYWTEQPKQGELLVFSGKLAHRVLPNASNCHRISIAFNFIV